MWEAFRLGDVIDALIDSGAVEGGGRMLRLTHEPDDMSIMDEQGDGVWCGRLEWGRRSSCTGHNLRPDGFDGGAEIIYTDGRDSLWWQVPADVKRGSDSYRSLRRVITDILEHGYQVVVVELCAGFNAYGDPVVREFASLGCVEPFPGRDYEREIVAGLVHEVLTPWAPPTADMLASFDECEQAGADGTLREVLA